MAEPQGAMQTSIQPVDDFIESGFIRMFHQQFNAPGVFVSSNEEEVAIAAGQGGKPLAYPYAFFRVQSWSHSTESYSSNRLARNGVIVAVEEHGLGAQTVRLLPVKYDVEVKFVTNAFNDVRNSTSVKSFVRRWLFARRNGSLGFNINYGKVVLAIQVLLAENVSMVPRENAPDAETAYKIIANATINGYMSEPVLGTVAIAKQLSLQTVLESQGLDGGTFVPFN